MNLGDILFFKFPEEIKSGKISLQDDGNGAYIKSWDVPGVQSPSKDTLKTWESETQKDYDKTAAINKRQAEYPTVDKLIVALWEKVAEGKTQEFDALQQQRLDVKTKYPLPASADKGIK